jgi:hypothetical protein
VIELQDRGFQRLQHGIVSRYIAGFDTMFIRGNQIRPERRRNVRAIAPRASLASRSSKTHSRRLASTPRWQRPELRH